MAKISIKSFKSADERRSFVSKGYADILSFEGRTVGLGVFEPGWKWSTHVKPIAGTKSCESNHSVYVLSGRMRIRMDDGEEAEVGPGDVALIPPGHDAWVVGNERCVGFDFSGMEHYAKREEEARYEAPGAETAPVH